MQRLEKDWITNETPCSFINYICNRRFLRFERYYFYALKNLTKIFPSFAVGQSGSKFHTCSHAKKIFNIH